MKIYLGSLLGLGLIVGEGQATQYDGWGLPPLPGGQRAYQIEKPDKIPEVADKDLPKDFDPDKYLELNPDVKERIMEMHGSEFLKNPENLKRCARNHYHKFGQKAGKKYK